MNNLQGRVAVITGGARGIGFATAQLLATRGVRVVIADIDESSALAAAKTLGDEALGLRVDIADSDSVATLVARIRERYGRIDILHNNAADTSHAIVGQDFDVVTTDLDVWDRTFAVNLRGTFLMCRHVIPVMLENGGGSIINMSSIEGTVPTPEVRVAYSTSKAAIVMLGRHIAATYGKRNIRCNSIAPGTTLTDTLRSHIDAATLARVMDRIRTPNLGEPIDIAEMVAYLASDAARYINGQVLAIDGGQTQYQSF